MTGWEMADSALSGTDLGPNARSRRQIQTGIGPLDVQRPKVRDSVVAQLGLQKIHIANPCG